MSIWSSVKNAVKKAATYTYNTVNKIGSGIASAFGGNSNTAAAANALVGSKVGPTYTGAGQNTAKDLKTGGYSAGGASGSWDYNSSVNSSGGIGNQSYGPSLPVSINAGQQKVSSGGGSSSGVNSLGGIGSASYGPTTISAKSLGVSSPTLGAGSNSLQGNIGASPVTLPSSPTSVNPNNIDNTKLAGNMAGYYTLGKDGTFTQVQDTQNTDAQDLQSRTDLIKSIIGDQPKDVNSDREVIAARKERQRIQQELLAPTSELNAVIAKQNQDLLQLRQTGSQEGVTEAVYGGQSNAINYNAAIRALPLQAKISSLQGDLKNAQDYLTELTQIKTDQIKSQSDYNNKLLSSILPYLDEKDKRTYDEKIKANDNATKEALDLEDFKAKLALTAMQNGGANVIDRIHNAKDKLSAVQAAGQYGATPNTQIVQLDNGKTVIVDKTSGKIVSDLGGQKETATYSTAGLTPEQAADPFIQKLANSAGGKPITDAFAQKLNKGLTVLDQIGGLQANIKDVKTGPIVGLFKGANPWDTNAQTIKAQLNAIVPNLARGVFGEVGVLTDNDIAQYSKTLPNLSSTEDIRNAVLGITVDLIGKSIKQTLEVNAANQKDVSGFIDIYTQMQATRDSIFSQIPGYKGGSSNSNSNIDYTSTLNSIFK